MRLVCLLLLLSSSLVSCQKKSTVQPAEIVPCNDSQLTRFKEIKNVKTTVRAITFSNGFGRSRIHYYLDRSNPSTPLDHWSACNLPDQFKKDNLSVQISGYELTFPGIEAADTDGALMELTMIDVN